MTVPEFSAEAMRRLVRLPYPGNIQRTAQCGGRDVMITAQTAVIGVEDIDRQCENACMMRHRRYRSSLERRYRITRCAAGYQASGGNMSKAAHCHWV